MTIEINIYREDITISMNILASTEKTIGLVLAIVGIIGVIFAAAWDILQGKTETNMGYLQLAGVAIGIVLFIIGLAVMFMMGGGEEQKREEWQEPSMPEQPQEQTEEQPPQPPEEPPEERIQ